MLYCIKGEQDRLGKYSRELDLVYDWFFNHNMLALPNEEMQFVDGDRVKVALQEYDTSVLEERGWETHDEYIDVMYIESGKEIVGVVPRERLGSVTVPYDPPHDITWYDGAEGASWVCLYPGDILVIFPEEGHCSRVCVGEPGFARKFVGKIHK